nr:DNA packaging protein UL33 [Psittacid alphaherpesvirus 6]
MSFAPPSTSRSHPDEYLEVSVDDQSPCAQRIVDLIPSSELSELSLDVLYERYLCDEGGDRRRHVAIWFEYIVPDELDLIFPTTDAKLNYLSFTRRLASAIHRGLPEDGTDSNNVNRDDGQDRHRHDATLCEHATALRERSDRFASVIDRFLDLHQILREA